MPRLAAPLSTFTCLIALVAGSQAFAHGPEHGPAPGPKPGPAPTSAPTQFDNGVPAPVAGRAPDSDAPRGAARHWLPHDMWVHLHGVPFDEARLQKLLRAARSLAAPVW